MRPSSGSRKVLLAVALIFAGCSGETDSGQGMVPGMDSGVGRTMARIDAGPDLAKDGVSKPGMDAPAVDAAQDGVGDGREMGDAPSLEPNITVEVDLRSLVPAKDGGVSDPMIVPSTFGPSPFVTVTVVSNTGDLKLDSISSVSAAIYDPLVATPVSTTKLAKSDSSVTPESNTMRFIFSGVPLDLSKLSSASYTVVFTASTVGGATGQTKVILSVDTGPSLNVKLPVEGGFYKGSAPIEVQATQNKFAITQVTMALGQGEAVPLTSMGSGLYKGMIDFATYTPPLEGPQLVTFRARNENDTEAIVLRKFVSDNTGPAISATMPANGAMIGNVITISATVDDPAGVDASSVIAVVANGDQNFEVTLNAAEGTKVYSSLFDTTKLPSYALYPTISFRARDRLGNESNTSYMLSLDNEPPLMDLDPHDIRLTRDEGGSRVCSWPFDPVGPDAVDDGDVVTQLFDVRARIEDQGNTPLTGEADFVLIGGINDAKVKLYVVGNPTRPLVVDSSDPPDGYCDDINPDLVPTTKPQTDMDAQVLDMVPLPVQGTADFSPSPASCSSTSGEPPAAICDTTFNTSKTQLLNGKGKPHGDRMTVAIGYNAKNMPAIYTLGPVVADKLQCAGRQFDASNNLKNGWACLAVKASDTLGNAQVSRPIRVCVVANTTDKGCADVRPLARVIPTEPLEIVTSEPLLAGNTPISAGTQIMIAGVTSDVSVNGRWIVDPVDVTGTRFSLRGAIGYGPKMCICKDGSCTSTSSCPTYALKLLLTTGQPIVVETDSPHGLEAGAAVMISGNTEQSGVAGVPWGISVIDANHFSLNGSVATAPLSPGGSMFSLVGTVPDCTGTLIKGGADGGRPLVDGTKPCKPWTNKAIFSHL